ncbi:MAG: hypothetical protein A3J07_04490 [Candidatus Doudnabacteria bacterium RIFCSPLOWO2_02_FULL_49_13]|uniref:Uncharacterized protein n=1 Tax=Candidatus Doudnabacteria bacterium RIFCSPHIGHO2_12_FULL_48_16 TaxID=1817838 RepID=A0A1F5PJP0_9BACT|nr:MAG: hypothetical protein A2760_00835 [Candidatus Doudnabacteria bacterium RIFCSPHIGHO2_01_FULL_50_67]OGE90165.1 MAG: hypothetical protein A3E29_03625 [Candidatus Doudnabacteria bacterium RIFCSPHIGHO2_12_FULL_48_16]OGE97825.1 MAG: hypothetical protein A2990_04235 [Candidatus Doudnabacteria bacterium RIFCSPLOWO2_01_FULL_49_40]OGF02762.1 MAG: hypothetical protein A3H14_03085 [Candidatus Doudnabacteria bacterium RIFCSPLOWO2_12_FULL_49_8]OGF03309.1 MAG: hypothetical protein A3J07_04490 [Candidat
MVGFGVFFLTASAKFAIFLSPLINQFMSKSKLILLGLGLAGGYMLFTASHASAAEYTPKAGDLIKTQTNATVFLVEDNLQRVPLSREAYVVRYGSDWSLIRTVADNQIGNYDYTGTINALSSHKTGTLVVYSLDNPEVFMLDHGFKKSLGHRTDLSGVEWIGTYEVYPSKQ